MFYNETSGREVMKQIFFVTGRLVKNLIQELL
jgi:hypothetical protein